MTTAEERELAMIKAFGETMRAVIDPLLARLEKIEARPDMSPEDRRVLATLTATIADNTRPLSSDEAFRRQVELATGRVPPPRFQPEEPRKIACRSLETLATFRAHVQQKQVAVRPDSRSALETITGVEWRIVELIDYTEPEFSDWPLEIKALVPSMGFPPDSIEIPMSKQVKGVPLDNDELKTVKQDFTRRHFFWQNFYQKDIRRYVGSAYREELSVDFQTVNASALEAARHRTAELEARLAEAERAGFVAKVIPSVAR
jgi:hypothetical protein